MTTPPARRDRGVRLLWAGITILVPGLLVSLASMSTVDLAYGIRAGGQILDGVDVLVVSATDQPAFAALVSGDSAWRTVYRDAEGLVAVRAAP